MWLSKMVVVVVWREDDVVEWMEKKSGRGWEIWVVIARVPSGD